MERKEYQQQYYQAHKEQYRDSQKRYASTAKGKDSQRHRSSKWKAKAGTQEHLKEYRREYMRKYRLEKKENKE